MNESLTRASPCDTKDTTISEYYLTNSSPEILKQIEEVGRPWNREELAKKRNAWVKERLKIDWREGLKEMSVWARDIEQIREKRITLNNNNNNNNMIHNNYNSTNTRLEGEGSIGNRR